MPDIGDLTAVDETLADGDILALHNISKGTNLKDQGLTITKLRTDAFLNVANTWAALQQLSVGGRSGAVTMADDTAVQIVSGSPGSGILIFFDNNSSTTWGIISYRGASVRYCIAMAAGSSVETAGAGSAPTGTTGTDGKVTIHATLTNNLWIENRLGSTRSIVYFLIG